MNWDPVADGISAAAGFYLWTAPSVTSATCLIKVENSANPAIFDISNAFFRISPEPFIDLSRPAGGEHFIVGTPINIQWTCVGVTTVDIYFSANGGGSWTPVVTGLATGAAGTFPCLVPDIVSDVCLIRIWNAADHSVFDISGFFTIDTLPSLDTIPPAPVADLAVDSVRFTSVLLSWTLTGDDGYVGYPSGIDIRYNRSPITELNWATSTVVGALPTPDTSGTRQTKWVTGFTPGDTIYFAMKVSDEVPNRSALSNVVRVIFPIPPDVVPPALFEITVTDIGCNRATLVWAAPGDDGNTGTADRYEFRYASYELNEANFATGTLIVGIPAPAPAGTVQSFVLLGLVAAANYWIGAYAFDESGNRSPLAVAHFETPSCPDTIPPAQITSLECSDFRLNSLRLSWIAPGDDYFVGRATSYEIRYSLEAFDASSWHSLPAYIPPITPALPGTWENVWVPGLESAEHYYLAVFTFDDVGNRSRMSLLTDCTTMGIAHWTSDMYKFEDAPPFLLNDLTNIFVPRGLEYWIDVGPGIELFFPDSLDDASEIWVRISPNWCGTTYVIMYAGHAGIVIADTAMIYVECVNDPPFFTNGMPDSIAVPGVNYTFLFTGYDVDDADITFFLEEGPLGMSVSGSGSLFWFPPTTEGHYDISVGLTDGEDTTYYNFPIRVFKLTDSIFAPTNLQAHSGFVASIPLTWDVPKAVLLGFPVHLAGYNIYRSDDFDEEPVFIGESEFNAYNDVDVECGFAKFYRVKAVYDVPSFLSAYSNMDDGVCNDASSRLYSTWIYEHIAIDGYQYESVWERATVLHLPDGSEFRILNTTTHLYGFVDFPVPPTYGQEFSFWFDDDVSGTWDFVPSDEGRIFFRCMDTIEAYWQPVANIGGYPALGTPSEMISARASWAAVGTHGSLEFSIPLGDVAHFGILPGDSSAIMLAASRPGVVLFDWPSSASELLPLTYGLLFLGTPGGIPSILISPTIMELTVEQGITVQRQLQILNTGVGTGFYEMTGMPYWLVPSPSYGFLYPGVPQTVIMTISADMEIGDYTAYINIYTTDPLNPVIQVEVILHVVPLVPENYLVMSLADAVHGNPGEMVFVPMNIGELYGRNIRSLRFTIFNDPDIANPVNIFAGTIVPAGWNLDITSIGEDHITIYAHGVDPLPSSGRFARLQYRIPYDADVGRLTELSFSDVVVDTGFPRPLTIDGNIIVGDRAFAFWSAMVVLVLPNGFPVDSASFGVHPLASNFYDPVLDQLDPPSFPGAENIYFLSDNGYQLVKDLRHLGDSLVIFTLVTQNSGRIVWDTNAVWSGCFIGDTIDMKTHTYINVTAGDTIRIYYHYTSMVFVRVHLDPGWNMVSIPIGGGALELHEAFPDAIWPAYTYDPIGGSYVATSELVPGRGYWVLVLEEHDYVLHGPPLYDFEFALSPGWFMIGSPSQTVYWHNEFSIPSDGLLAGALFGYNTLFPSYFISRVLIPGEGYWIMAMSPCRVSVRAIYLP